MLPSDSSTASTISVASSHSSKLCESNPILPTVKQVHEVFARSKQIWQSYLKQARSMDHISSDNLNLSGLLHRLPALPDDLEGISVLRGHSTWLNSSSDCHLKVRTELQQQWSPVLEYPTICKVSLQTGSGHNNGISIALFCWSYILCMRMLEKQRLPMQYSSTLAPYTRLSEDNEDEHCITIDIGDAAPDELRWWRALLAPGQGWQASMSQQPPWAIAYNGDLTFKVATTAELLTYSAAEQPPSSTRAMQFLSRFSSMYRLDAQALTALAIALTLPLHNWSNSTVQLSRPNLIKACFPPSTSPATILQEYENISHYMTLSSNPRFLSSALWSTFWEAGVDCNLVSPWCDPIMEVVQPLIENNNLDLLAHILALRRPNLAALWYGVAQCGRTKTIEAVIPFLKTLQTPMPARPIPEVASWTGSPQSFIDLCGFGPYKREDNTITRADVWRLRHDCWKDEPEGMPFRNPPLSGWPPFGTMQADDLELGVRGHINCKRHSWTYDRWTWHLGSKCDVSDRGYKDQYTNWSSGLDKCTELDQYNAVVEYESDYKPNNIASKRAVEDAFRWAATQIEYTQRSIYTHPWVSADADLLSQNDLDLVTSGPSRSEEAMDRVEDWRRAVIPELRDVVAAYQS